MFETLEKSEADTMNFIEPGSIDEAVRLLSENGSEAVILAGGLDLVPRLRHGEINPKTVVSVSAIEGLNQQDQLWLILARINLRGWLTA